MHHTVTLIPNSEAELNVTIPLVELEAHVKRAAVLISEEREIEGFRKGKAPYDIVKERVGEFSIYERGAELAVRAAYPKLMEELMSGELAKTPPIGHPEIAITKLAPGSDLTFKVKLALFPQITLPDYRAIARRVREGKQAVVVKEEEIEKTIDWIRESRAALVTVNRTAAPGDAVTIDFDTRHGGVKIEGGESKNHLFILGKGQFLPGFEDALTGMKAGEEKSFSLQAPKDWHDKGYAEKSLDFTVKMNLVQERSMPELTDEFVKGLGNFDSVAALKKNVAEGLAQEKEEKETQRIRALLVEAIAEKSTMDVPRVLIDREIEKMTEELRAQIVQMGMQWEDYLTHIKKTPEDLARDWRDDAERRVRIALCLREIGVAEKIEPTAEEIETRANEMLARYKSAENAKKDFDPEALRGYTKDVLVNEKVFRFLETI